MVKDTLEKVFKIDKRSSKVSNLRVYRSSFDNIFNILVAYQNSEICYFEINFEQHKLVKLFNFHILAELDEDIVNCLKISTSNKKMRLITSHFLSPQILCHEPDGSEVFTMETGLYFIETIEVDENEDQQLLFATQFCGDFVHCFDLLKKSCVFKINCVKTNFSFKLLRSERGFYTVYVKNKGTIAVFNNDSRVEVYSAKLSEDSLSKVEIFNKRLGLVSTFKGELILFNLSTGVKVQSAMLADSDIYAVHAIKNGKYGEGLLLSCTDGQVKLVVPKKNNSDNCLIF